MARIIITIEDSMMGDKVKFTMNPSFATLAAKIAGGHDGGKITCAEGYAMGCANYVRNESKKMGQPNKIIIPRLRSM